VWSKPYIQLIVDGVKRTHPTTPLTLYANGSGGLLERMATTGVDCIGLDWSVDMADGRKRLGGACKRHDLVPPTRPLFLSLGTTSCIRPAALLHSKPCASLNC